jgi:predicted esterase
LDLSNQILESTLEQGIWYSESLLRQSPSLGILQGHPDFERLATISLKMLAAEPEIAMPLLVVHPEGKCGKDDLPCPMLLFLHGNNDTAQANLAHWQTVPSDGWLLTMPQSHDAMWAGAYIWSDHDASADQIEAHFEYLVTQYAIDPSRLVLAGLSMGAELALWLTLSRRFNAQGFILLGPGGPMIDKLNTWDPFLINAEDLHLRGTIIMGEEDTTIPQDNVHMLVEKLNQNGVACKLETHPNLGHGYPPDFDQIIHRALEHIFEEK